MKDYENIWQNLTKFLADSRESDRIRETPKESDRMQKNTRIQYENKPIFQYRKIYQRIWYDRVEFKRIQKNSKESAWFQEKLIESEKIQENLRKYERIRNNSDKIWENPTNPGDYEKHRKEN